jgi:hypothetical protein
MSKTKVEEEKTGSSKFPGQSISIASYMKKAMKASSTIQLPGLGMKKVGLLAANSDEFSLGQPMFVKPTKSIKKTETALEHPDLDSLDFDEDDMEIDDMPELALK